MYRGFVIAAVLILLSSTVLQAQDVCSIAAESLQSLTDSCSSIERNQTCFAGAVEVSAHDSTLVIDQAGVGVDVAQVATLQLDGGAVALKLQANLPGSTPDQNVTVLAAGSVTLTNTVIPYPELLVNATANARIRRAPDSTVDNVIAVLPSGTQTTAIGRNTGGDWVRVFVAPEFLNPGSRGDDMYGWTSRQVVNVQGTVMDLPVLGDAEKPLRPMQSFVLNSEPSEPCTDTALNGVLLQSPTPGETRVRLIINGVSVAFNSTAYIETADSTLTVTILDGIGFIEANEGSQVVPAGAQVRIPLAEDLTTAVGQPEFPQPTSEQLISTLTDTLAALTTATIESRVSVQFTPVELSTALSTDAIEDAIAVAQNTLGLLPGVWQVTTTNIITIRDEWGPQFGVNICQAGFGYQLGAVNRWPMSWNITNTNGTYGDSASEVARVRGATVALGESLTAYSVVMASPTLAYETRVQNSYFSTEGRMDDAKPGVFICEFRQEYRWIGD